MRIGAHMSVSGGKYMAFESGKVLGCEAIQVFVRNVRGWSSGPLKQEEIDEFKNKKEELKEEIWPVISHNSYLVNFASLDKKKLEKSYNAMVDELTKVEQLTIEYENMHPGVIPISDKKEITKNEALTQIAEQLNKLMEVTKTSKVIIVPRTLNMPVPSSPKGGSRGMVFPLFCPNKKMRVAALADILINHLFLKFETLNLGISR